MRRDLYRLSLMIAAVLTCAPARGELFMLASGGQVRGELVNRDEVPRTRYVIRPEAGGEVTLSRDQVVKVVRESAAQVEYERIRAGYPDTVAAQWELAEWCREHKLSQARKVHLERVIALDPEHVLARRGLGYSKVDGRWVTQEQMMTERGYKLYKGKWRLPQEIELLENRRQAELAGKEWRQRLKRWRAWLDDEEKSEDAVASIVAIRDPFAVAALGDGLEDEENEKVRVIYLESLGRIGTPDALKVLVDRSLFDKSEEARLTSIDQLAAHANPDLVALFVKSLKHKENKIVNRAGLALGLLGDKSAVGPLIDALVTTHKFTITTGSGGRTTTTFQPNGGGGGFAMGQSTKIVSEKLQNESVRDALIKLAGVNHNYDKASWKRWYAAQKKDRELNGRRD